MEARTDLIQLKADLKDEENRTNMFALEVCELTSDKKRLQDENFVKRYLIIGDISNTPVLLRTAKYSCSTLV